jgi:glutamyl-tRNA reductase
MSYPKLAMSGLNHMTAPLEVRERFAFANEALERILAARFTDPDRPDCFILSTCNRTEIYITPRVEDIPCEPPGNLLASLRGLAPEDLAPYLYHAKDAAAVRHLFAVAGGTDSMVVGEHEILGQVRNAAEIARRAGTLGKVLDRLCNRAVETGRRVRTETAIGHGGLSIASVAVALAERVFPDLSHACTLILGAGENGELLAERLVSRGVKNILVSNRTYDRSAELAERFGGQAVHFSALSDVLCHADIVISSTGAPHHVVDADVMSAAMRARPERPMFCIDLAVPRDIDPAAAAIENVHVYDIDHLEQGVAQNARERERELPRAGEIIDEEAARFSCWLYSLDALSTVLLLREKAECARQQEVSEALTRCKRLTRADEKAIHDLSKSLVRRLIGEAIARLQDGATNLTVEEHARVLRELFALEEYESNRAREDE